MCVFSGSSKQKATKSRINFRRDSCLMYQVTRATTRAETSDERMVEKQSRELMAICLEVINFSTRRSRHSEHDWLVFGGFSALGNAAKGVENCNRKNVKLFGRKTISLKICLLLFAPHQCTSFKLASLSLSKRDEEKLVDDVARTASRQWKIHRIH